MCVLSHLRRTWGNEGANVFKDRGCSLSPPRGAYKHRCRNTLGQHTVTRAARSATLSAYSKQSTASISEAQAASPTPAVCGDKGSVAPGAFCLGMNALSMPQKVLRRAEGAGTAGTQPGGGSKFGRATLTRVSDVISSSRWWDSRVPGQHVWETGQEGMSVPVIFTFIITAAAGRSTAARDALCVEVLKTSAGLGLSLDGGKSSVSGDGPLFIKRVYKGNVLENSICLPLPIFFLCISLPSSWKSNF